MAHLVANGSSQQLGVDFDETFSPVVKPVTIRTVLSLVMSRKWPIHHLDVKNAFLNDDLSETVYMHQPPGFVDSRYPHYVYLLQRSLYGLKQGLRVAYLLIYVDDIILTASSSVLLQQIIDSLHKELILSQKKYALQLLELAHMVHCNPSRTLVDTETNLVQHICLYMHDPRKPHFAALKRVKRYVKGTLDLGFHVYASATTSLMGYTDADWAGCPSTRRSTSVYCDNVSAVNMSANPIQHQRTKNIEIDIHFVRDMVKAGHIRVFHVPSRFKYADIFTKRLPSALFEDFRSSLSVRPPPAQTAGRISMYIFLFATGELNRLTNGERIRWLYRVNQFFLLDSVADDQKVREVQKRFDLVFEDPMGGLMKTEETGGLKDEISMLVRMFKPNTLTDVYCLARMQGATLHVLKTKQTPLLSTSKAPCTNSYANRSMTYPPKTTTANLAIPAPPNTELTKSAYCRVVGSNSKDCELEELLLDEPVVQNFEETLVEAPLISLHALRKLLIR
ncbi:ribonuclease H-like domain-containing protein [Tanacetum coccineum]|uniref:Ribonuclease H-like domain-containing protein n=1 Tax=Tanacetum coccineum TaxID=301880 RepID=A0ABQ5GMK4_9ASTR